MHDLQIDIDFSEWDAAFRTLNFLDNKTGSVLTSVSLKAHNGKRHWIGSNEFRGICVTGDADSREYEVLISKSAFYIAWTTASTEGFCPIRIEDNVVTIGVNTQSVSYPISRGRHPFSSDTFDYSEQDSIFSISSRNFFHIIASLRYQAKTEEEANSSVVFLTNSSHGFCLDLHINQELALSVELPARYISGPPTCNVAFQTNVLAKVLEDAPFEDDVLVVFPSDGLKPIVIQNENVRTILMPLQTVLHTACKNVEAVLTEVCGSLSLDKDADGDYVISRHGHRIYGRLHGNTRETIFQVFAVILDNVELSSELLTEINQINSNIEYARVFFIGGQVLVEADLVALSCDAIELEVALDRIKRVAGEIAPMLNAVFGGEVHEDPSEQRWANYRQAIVRANVTPTELSDLNGVHAIDVWPFPGAVYVLTGWNPQGVTLQGNEINTMIAGEILKHGGHFVEGAGGSVDGTYSEPSLIAWGLSREAALRIGRKAHQDAIFEIDADYVRLVDCLSDRIEESSRVIQSQS